MSNIKKILVIFMILLILINTTGKNIYSASNDKNLEKNTPKINPEDLLDDDNKMWRIDSDGDGLSDYMEEILGTDKNKKDTDGDGLDDMLEYKMNLDPTKKDTDGNGIYDGDEDSDSDGVSNKDEILRNRNPSINDNYIDPRKISTREKVEVTKKMMLEACLLVEGGVQYDYKGKKVKDIYPEQYKDIADFTIIRVTKEEKGFFAVAMKKGNALIVTYKGSDDFLDWIGNAITQFGPHPQRQMAIDFIEPLINKHDNIYVCGHSLGGLLVQYVVYDLYNKEVKNIYGYTFNSANNMNPRHIKGEFGPPLLKENLLDDYKLFYSNLLSPLSNKENLVKFFDKSIQEEGFVDLENIKWQNNGFNDQIYIEYIGNDILKEDPLYKIIGGGYLGEENIFNSKYQYENVEGNMQTIIAAHNIKNFEEVYKLINNNKKLLYR